MALGTWGIGTWLDLMGNEGYRSRGLWGEAKASTQNQDVEAWRWEGARWSGMAGVGWAWGWLWYII